MRTYSSLFGSPSLAKGSVALASVALLAATTGCSTDDSDASIGSSASSSSTTTTTASEDSGPNPTTSNGTDESDDDSDSDSDSSGSDSSGSADEGRPIGTDDPRNEVTSIVVDGIPEEAFPGAGTRVREEDAKLITSTAG